MYGEIIQVDYAPYVLVHKNVGVNTSITIDVRNDDFKSGVLVYMMELKDYSILINSKDHIDFRYPLNIVYNLRAWGKTEFRYKEFRING